MNIIILAGGFGSRLVNETLHIPKPLVKINNNKTILDLILENICIELNNIDKKFIFCCYYKAEIIVNYLKNIHKKLNYEVIIEKEKLGTGGAVINAIKNSQEEFLIINADTFIKVNLKEFLFKCRNSKKSFGIVISNKCENFMGIKNIFFDYKNQKICFDNKNGNMIDCGIYYFINTLNLTFKNSKCEIISIINTMIDIDNLNAYTVEEHLIDIGTPERLKYAREIFRNH